MYKIAAEYIIKPTHPLATFKKHLTINDKYYFRVRKCKNIFQTNGSRNKGV